MNITLCALFIFFFCLFIKWYLQNRRYMKLVKRFPNPPTLPIVGNALDLKSPTDFIPRFAEYTALYGDKIKLYMGMFPNVLLVTDLRLMTHVLSSTTILKKGVEYSFLSRWLGKGLLISDGDSRWKKHRKLINPSFHIQILKEFIETFQSNTNILVEKLQSELGNTSFNVYPYVTMCALDIICETALGTFINAQNNDNSSYVKSVKEMLKLIVTRAYNAFLRTDCIYKCSRLYKDEKRCVQVLNDYTKEVIRQRKKQFKTPTQNAIDESEKKLKMVLLDLLLQQNEDYETFTDDDIQDEVNTFMFAGHDTSASALTFAIFSLAENPTVQDKVVKELDQICDGDKKKIFTLNEIQSMKYLDAVIKEVLRLYPPVPYISRTVEEDFDFDDYTIPKGITLLINIYGFHHHPKLYAEPERFNPERFLTENVEERFNYGFLPFGFGPRNCIGQKFAMLEMKTVLAVLLQHYKFIRAVPSHQLQLSTESILLSKNGVFVGLTKRTDY